MRGEKGKKFNVHYILLWKCYMKLNTMWKWINDNKSKRKQLSVSQFASDRNNITVRHTAWFSCCFSKRHWVKTAICKQRKKTSFENNPASRHLSSELWENKSFLCMCVLETQASQDLCLFPKCWDFRCVPLELAEN